MRNNLWYSVSGVDQCKEPLLWEAGTTSSELGWWTDLDYDAFGRGDKTRGEVEESLSKLVESTGRYANAVAIDGSCFVSLDIPGPAPMSVPEQRIELTADCPAVDAGEIIPGVNDDYKGTAPDMGAFEFGGAAPQFGPRPLEQCGEEEDCVVEDDLPEDTGREELEETEPPSEESGCGGCNMTSTGVLGGLPLGLVVVALGRRRMEGGSRGKTT